jgi:hypothetical protein
MDAQVNWEDGEAKIQESLERRVNDHGVTVRYRALPSSKVEEEEPVAFGADLRTIQGYLKDNASHNLHLVIKCGSAGTARTTRPLQAGLNDMSQSGRALAET